MIKIKKYNDFISENSKTTIRVSREEFDKIADDYMKKPISHWNGGKGVYVNGVAREPDFIEYPTRDQAENYAFWKITGSWPRNDDVSSFWDGTSSIGIDGVWFVADVEGSKF